MPETKTPTFNQWISRIGEIIRNNLIFLLILLLIGISYLYFREYGFDLLAWDMMLISGLLAFIIAAQMARTTPAKIEQTIDRLAARNAFEISEENLESFKSKIMKRAQRFSKISALAVGIVMLVAFIWAFGEYILTGGLALTLLEIILGMVAGYYVGQMIAFGSLGQLVRREKLSVVATPGHIDQAAGLKPIGAFYFFQAMILAIPCAYIAIWWFVIPLHPLAYDIWRDPYLMLLAIALTLEFLAFFLPMWIFHLIMREQKDKYLKEADGLSEEIIKLEQHILHADDPASVSDIQKQLDFLREKYWQIENMPTWPVDALIRRKFTTNNLLLFLPFFSDMIKSTPLKKFLDTLYEFITS
jgi:hypothetical protein